jgi:2,3-diketo-5-methylthio-1-phosphopentane phosphatase
VLDFDGTVTEKDVGDEICERFAAPEWKQIDDAWVRNEISLPEAQRRMWALAECGESEALAHARAVGRLRPGLDQLLDSVERRGGEVWLASGGFDFYIRALLGTRLARFGRTYFNGARFRDGVVQVDFPHDQLACGRCAVCKGKVCELAQSRGERVVFVGDGASDRCAIGRADLLCAVEGSLLARACEERGVDYLPFRELADVIDGL